MMAAKPDFETAKNYALRRLDQELSPLLTYHSLAHTRDEVVLAAERLAALEGIASEDLMLLSTAAYFHDIGFTIQRENHEAVGIQVVQQVLPGFGYSSRQIQIIGGMIQATIIPQAPHTLMEEIIADADLDSLGREDFWPRSLALRTELANFGEMISDRAWYERQIRFMSGLQYFTASARAMREAQKQANIAWLVERLAAAS